jgi:putative N6-adenine-specific DNA methylase
VRALGLTGARVEGGVELEGDLAVVARLNRELRAATRVLVRAGEVRARDFEALRRGAGQLDWRRFARGGVRASVTATAHKSRLYHTGGIAERVEQAVIAALGAGEEPLDLIVRGERDVFTISVDSSGELLHKRGYRLEDAGAPLRETLAAGMLALAGWKPDEPLVDPMCGSGTIVIEAALTRLPRRGYAFERWPGAENLSTTDDKFVTGQRQISGFDVDPGTIALARRNAERAGVNVSLEVADVRALKLDGPPGLILTNPPYGQRLRPAELRPIYEALGRLARSSGWRLALLTTDERLARASGTPRGAHRLVNGGLRVTLYTFGGN